MTKLQKHLTNSHTRSSEIRLGLCLEKPFKTFTDYDHVVQKMTKWAKWIT